MLDFPNYFQVEAHNGLLDMPVQSLSFHIFLRIKVNDRRQSRCIPPKVKRISNQIECIDEENGRNGK
jgi:hypothetical protein